MTTSPLNEQGVIPVTKLHTLSTWTGKGQHQTNPHSGRSTKAGQTWGRHDVVRIVPACSTTTRELVQVRVLGECSACPECGLVPVWDHRGNLACNCRIWGDPEPIQGQPDMSLGIKIIREKRNQNYQRDMRRFFKGGRC